MGDKDKDKDKDIRNGMDATISNGMEDTIRKNINIDTATTTTTGSTTATKSNHNHNHNHASFVRNVLPTILLPIQNHPIFEYDNISTISQKRNYYCMINIKRILRPSLIIYSQNGWKGSIFLTKDEILSRVWSRSSSSSLASIATTVTATDGDGDGGKDNKEGREDNDGSDVKKATFSIVRQAALRLQLYGLVMNDPTTATTTTTTTNNTTERNSNDDSKHSDTRNSNNNNNNKSNTSTRIIRNEYDFFTQYNALFRDHSDNNNNNRRKIGYDKVKEEDGNSQNIPLPKKVNRKRKRRRKNSKSGGTNSSTSTTATTITQLRNDYIQEICSILECISFVLPPNSISFSKFVFEKVLSLPYRPACSILLKEIVDFFELESFSSKTLPLISNQSKINSSSSSSSSSLPPP